MRQAVSLPGQSVATVQPMHWPVASQWLAPPQFEFAGIIVCEGAPGAQRSFVHALRSSGTSVSSFTVATVPSVAHWRRLQSPVDWTARTVPAASRVLPHAPAVQVRCSHSDSIPGQSAATLHAAQVLLARHAYWQSRVRETGVAGPALAAVATAIDAGLVAVLDAVVAGRRRAVVAAAVGASAGAAVVAGRAARARAARRAACAGARVAARRAAVPALPVVEPPLPPFAGLSPPTSARSLDTEPSPIPSPAPSRASVLGLPSPQPMAATDTINSEQSRYARIEPPEKICGRAKITRTFHLLTAVLLLTCRIACVCRAAACALPCSGGWMRLSLRTDARILMRRPTQRST